VKLNYRKSIIFSLAIFSLAPYVVYAHGVMGKVGRGGIVVAAEYPTGEPMSYARGRISASQPLKNPVSRLISCYERVITGMSIIFGIAGLILWWRAKKVYGQRDP